VTSQAAPFGEFDYVIAGGGTAGCTLANRLSADPEVTVLLLEAGGKDDWIWIHIPIGYLYCINNPRTDWCYKTEPEPGLNGRSIIYARGKVLGGSSSINAMLSLRGQVRDYEEWARITGDSRWNWESVLPVFKQSESYWRGADEFHGDKRRMAGREAAPALGRARSLCRGGATGRAFPSPAITTAVITSASATSRSTRRRACAGTRPRPCCVRCSTAAT
jgi:choline dehydrogenase-like flavoprotein